MNVKNKSYGMVKGVAIFLILSGFISLVQAYQLTELQWDTGVSGKLHRGEELAYNEYSVKAVMFPGGVESERYSETPSESIQAYVGLNISKDGNLINTTVLGLAESYVTPDGELRVTAKELPAKNATEWLLESYNPWAVIEINPRGKPNLEVSIDTDKSEYSASDDTEIFAVVTIQNTGSADAVNVDTVIDTTLSVKSGSLKNHYERIKKGESVEETITFVSPVPTEDKEYNMSANVSAYDVKDIQYKVTSLKTIPISVDPEWSMSLRKTTLDKIYLKDSAMVSLSLKNNGKYDVKNVSIYDSLPRGFKLVSNTSLHWIIDIPAGGEWSYRYLVTPEEQNAKGVVFPVATAEFKVKKELYGIRSNQPKMIVYGSKVVLTKNTDVSEVNPGDTVSVTVNAENTGSTPTMVTINDRLPEGVTLIDGVTAYEEFLEAGKEVSFSYTLLIDSIDAEHPVVLPPATAEYYKIGNKGGKINTTSQGVELRIKPPAPTYVPTPEVTEPPPDVTPEPAVEKNNSAQENVVNGQRQTGHGNRNQAEQAEGVDTVLSYILGCDNNSINDSRTAAEYNACNFFRQNLS